jgi:hypothetical protein
MAVGPQGSSGYPGYSGGVPPPPVPVKKSGGIGWVVWTLVGCGTLTVIAVIFTVVAIAGGMGKQTGFQGAVTGIVSATECGQSLKSVRAALRNYRRDHNGNYPPSLSALIPDYLADEKSLGCGQSSDRSPARLEYKPPKPDAPPETIVISIFTGETSMLNIQQQSLYVRLLKDDRIVLDQVVRQEIAPPPSSRPERPE